MRPATILCAAVSSLLIAGIARGENAPAARTTLCQALAAIGSDGPKEIEVSGVYLSGMESQTLYDPAESPCATSMQSSTWVEFAPHTPKLAELNRIVSGKSNRAYVTVRGDLYGPKPVPPDDPKLSADVALVMRMSSRVRYGHLGGWRTKLVVREIEDVRPVPESTPWPKAGAEPDPAGPTVLQGGEIPRYPETARKLGISGEVELEVTVADGKATAKVLSGDRALAAEAVANVRTWRFSTYVANTFVTRFIYQLEQHRAGADWNPRIVMELPRRVVITAARSDW